MTTARVVSKHYLAEFAQTTSAKTMVSNATGEKQGSGAGGATEASSPEKKKPLVRSNRIPTPNPTMSSGKLRDLRRDIEHNWQMVDGGVTVKNNVHQNETDYFGAWGKGRLLKEATVKAISRR